MSGARRLRDQRQELGEVHPFERRDAVVLACDDGAFGVEEAHGGQCVIRTPAMLGGSEHPRDHFPCALVAADPEVLAAGVRQAPGETGATR